MSDEGHRLDPDDWAAYRRQMHALLDRCVDRMQESRDLPWQPVPDGMAARLRLSGEGAGTEATFARLTDEIMPFATGNTHPRFFGWVHGTGLPVAVGAELVAATMNSNCGGRDHGAVEVERAVGAWLLGIAGMPATGSAILTTGTSQATVLALCVARHRRFGDRVRESGVAGLPPIRVYVTEATHSCTGGALEILGHGSQALRTVPMEDGFRMDLAALRRMVAEDREAGVLPLAVVATAGAVDTGSFDPFDALADFCEASDLWLHVDGAFGFWLALAGAPWADLVRGIGRANSIVCDFHKWISVPYACGACMIHDAKLHRATFSSRPSYLQSQEAGLAGGDLWYCDYGFDLSRGFRALKVWTAIEAIGTDAFGRAIADNCRQAAYMAALVEASEVLELAFQPIANLCCFHVSAGEPAAIAARLQLDGTAVFSTTTMNGRPCLRAAIVNHRTTRDDIELAIRAVEAEVRASA